MAQAGAPTLSVVITVYNGEEDLPRALDSLRAQTFDDFELLVVDNGSNDGTWDYIQELSWQRMRGHRLKERRHEVDAFTQALAWAQGQYVVHHGARDVSTPGRFEAQIERMKRGRTLGAVGAYARWVDAEGGTLREIKPPSGHKAILKWLEREDAEFVLGIARGAAMLNREALDAVGGFRTALGHAAFLDIWLRLAASDYKLANVTTPLYTVHFNPAAPYIRFHAEARAFATLARDLTKGDGDEKVTEKAGAEKAGGAESEKAGEKAGAPPDALKAEVKPPVDKGDEKPEDQEGAEKGESAESEGEEKPAVAKVDAGDEPPAGKEAVKKKSAPEAEAAEGDKGAEAKGEAKAEKPEDGVEADAVEAAESGGKEKPPAAKVDAEDKPPAGQEPAEEKAESASGEVADEEKKGEGEKADEKAEKPAGAKSAGEDVKAEAEGKPPTGDEPAEADEKSEAGAAEGEKKGEAEDKEAKKPEEEDKPVEADKPTESAEKAPPTKSEAGGEGEPPAGKKPAEAELESEAGAAEGEKKREAEGKEAEKPEEVDKPVEAEKAAESAEKGTPVKSESGGKGEPPAGKKPAEAGETSGAGEPEEDKKLEAGEKEAGKPEKSGPAEVDETEVSTEKMTPVERARRLAAERADRGLAARLRERSDNYLAWAARFDEWGGAAGEHVRQMWTRALLAYPLNPQVWAFAYRRLADRYLGGGDQDDAGPEA